jgi:hypothetical protein
MTMKPDTDHTKSETPGIPKKAKKPRRDVETMFRLSFSTHQKLSYMADQKAYIMITVNTIILSAVISLLLRHLDKASWLLIPTCMLLAVSLATIVFAVLSTRPNIPRGIFTKDELESKKVNFLFFGNYYRMPFADYKTGMGHMMEDMEYLNESMLRDGYAQAKVLGKKYGLLRHSYNVFMYGLILSVIAFVIVSLTSTNPMFN